MIILDYLKQKKGEKIDDSIIEKVKFLEENSLSELVYFVRNGDSENVKIGKSKDLKNRIPQLQTGFDKTLFIDGIILYNSTVYDAEKEAHKFFNKERIRGEWFNISKEDVLFYLTKNKGIRIFDFYDSKTANYLDKDIELEDIISINGFDTKFDRKVFSLINNKQVNFNCKIYTTDFVRDFKESFVEFEHVSNQKMLSSMKKICLFLDYQLIQFKSPKRGFAIITDQKKYQDNIKKDVTY